jgi:hypothetical protein
MGTPITPQPSAFVVQIADSTTTVSRALSIAIGSGSGLNGSVTMRGVVIQ